MTALSKAHALRLYATMLRIRLCEESLVAPILQGAIRCPAHLYTGQEAVAVGLCAALTRRDYIFGNHRSHGHYLAKGGDLNALVAEMFGKTTGCSGGRGGSMHVIAPRVGFLGSAPIVAGTIALAVGAALAAAIRRDGRVTVSFFGDGATDEGVFYEALNFAALRRLPLIFVCENNFYSTHLPIQECRAEPRIARTAPALGVTGLRVDGNDVGRVYAAARAAVARCRRGQGPVLMECLTYRLRGHVGPDDNVQGQHTDIRPLSEIARWRRKDPLVRCERELRRRYGCTPATFARLRARLQREIEAAHAFARRSPYPRARDLKRHVFV